MKNTHTWYLVICYLVLRFANCLWLLLVCACNFYLLLCVAVFSLRPPRQLVFPLCGVDRISPPSRQLFCQCCYSVYPLTWCRCGWKLFSGSFLTTRSIWQKTCQNSKFLEIRILPSFCMDIPQALCWQVFRNLDLLRIPFGKLFARLENPKIPKLAPWATSHSIVKNGPETACCG